MGLCAYRNMNILNLIQIYKQLTFINFAEGEENKEEEEARVRRAVMPSIRTVAVDTRIVHVNEFGMYNWVDLQEILKNNYFLIKNGNK